MNNENILVVDDEADIRSLIQEILTDEGYQVTIAADGLEAREIYQREQPDMVLLDIWMPDVDGISLLQEWSESPGTLCPVVIMSGHGTVDTAIEATRLGAVDYIEKPLSLAQLLRTTEAALKQKQPGMKGSAAAQSSLAPVGKSQAMELLREQCQVLAGHDAPALISGEPGSGRRQVAGYVHSLSSRAAKPMGFVGGGALIEDDAARQLFGISTASGFVPGLLEQNAGSTLYISDIDNMDAAAQKLLQAVLSQGYFLHPETGSTVELKVRVIASTGSESVVAETLSVELRRVLSALKLNVPALRDYHEDIPELLRHTVDYLVETEGLQYRQFSVAAQNRLRNYPWPGNVLQLKRLVREALLSRQDGQVSLDEVEALLEVEQVTTEGGSMVSSDMLSMTLREAREAFEKEYLMRQLELAEGKVGKLAERVGMERTHLYRKLRSLGVSIRRGSD